MDPEFVDRLVSSSTNGMRGASTPPLYENHCGALNGNGLQVDLDEEEVGEVVSYRAVVAEVEDLDDTDEVSSPSAPEEQEEDGELVL